MRINLFSTELQAYPLTIPENQTLSSQITARSDFAIGYAVVQNYNGQPAVRKDREQMKAILPVRNVFWQFLWAQNGSVLHTVRQEFFTQTIIFPYECHKLLRGLDQFYVGNPNPAYSLRIRAVAPSGTQLQFTNMGGLWFDTN